jgi:hypothetical protein
MTMLYDGGALRVGGRWLHGADMRLVGGRNRVVATYLRGALRADVHTREPFSAEGQRCCGESTRRDVSPEVTRLVDESASQGPSSMQGKKDPCPSVNAKAAWWKGGDFGSVGGAIFARNLAIKALDTPRECDTCAFPAAMKGNPCKWTLINPVNKPDCRWDPVLPILHCPEQPLGWRSGCECIAIKLPPK